MPFVTVTKVNLDNLGAVPTNITEQNLLSETSHAYPCFTQQKFSQRLQVYLIGYILSVTSYRSVYK